MSQAYTGKLPTLPKRGYFKKGDKGAQVKLLQKYLNWANEGRAKKDLVVDGEYGDKTASAVKFFEQVHHLEPLDGEFGKKCLKCAKKVKMDRGLMATNWAYSTMLKHTYHYKNWKPNVKATHVCPICHKDMCVDKHGQIIYEYWGWNCIGFVTAAMYHGAKMRGFTCSCSGLGNNSFFEHITLEKWRNHNGKNWTMISNGGSIGGKSIDKSKLRAGDVLICYTSNGTFKHMAMYVGGGKYIDCTSGHVPNIGVRSYDGLAKRLHVTRAFRPI